MIVIFVCIVLMLIPLATLAILLPSFSKIQDLPFIVRLAIGVIFFSFGLSATYAAMLVWLSLGQTNADSGVNPIIRWFVPVGLVVNFIGVSYLLFLRKK